MVILLILHSVQIKRNSISQKIENMHKRNIKYELRYVSSIIKSRIASEFMQSNYFHTVEDWFVQTVSKDSFFLYNFYLDDFSGYVAIRNDIFAWNLINSSNVVVYLPSQLNIDGKDNVFIGITLAGNLKYMNQKPTWETVDVLKLLDNYSERSNLQNTIH